MKGVISVLLLSAAFALADINSQCPEDYTIEAFLPHEDCNKYYQCVHGKAIEFTCAETLFFNSKTQQCDYQENVDCSDRAPKEVSSEELLQLPICECPEDFTKELLFPHEDCTKFYKCYQGKPAEIDCQPGLVYNAEKEWCDWPQNVNCDNRQFTCPDPNEILAEVEKDQQVSSDCPIDWSIEKLLPNADCKKFNKCQQGIPIPQDCPFGLYYNVNSERCDWPQNVDCSGRAQ